MNNSKTFTPTVTYFLPGHNQESDRRTSTEITKQLQWDFEDIFNGVGYFDGMFPLQLKQDSKPHHSPLRH